MWHGPHQVLLDYPRMDGTRALYKGTIWYEKVPLAITTCAWEERKHKDFLRKRILMGDGDITDKTIARAFKQRTFTHISSTDLQGGPLIFIREQCPPVVRIQIQC